MDMRKTTIGENLLSNIQNHKMEERILVKKQYDRFTGKKKDI